MHDRFSIISGSPIGFRFPFNCTSTVQQSAEPENPSTQQSSDQWIYTRVRMERKKAHDSLHIA